MKTYFIHIAMVRMAARLVGKKLYDNYAFHGALPRFDSVCLNDIVDSELVEDVPLKIDSFIFGHKCGVVLNKYLSTYNNLEILYMESCIAQALFLKLTPERRKCFTNAELLELLGLVFRTLIKKIQIHTHTMKPGVEDINAWLVRLYELQRNYDSFISTLADVIINPNPVLVGQFDSFFDKKDEIVTLALKDDMLYSDTLKNVLDQEPHSNFGKILKKIVISLEV